MADVAAKDGYGWESPDPADTPPAAPPAVGAGRANARRRHDDEDDDGGKAGYGWDDESPETSRNAEGHFESGTRV
jgi:hypothetical protein